MPFGGQGESGCKRALAKVARHDTDDKNSPDGMWFGKSTFDTFTHSRGTITVPFSCVSFSIATRTRTAFSISHPDYIPAGRRRGLKDGTVRTPKPNTRHHALLGGSRYLPSCSVGVVTCKLSCLYIRSAFAYEVGCRSVFCSRWGLGLIVDCSESNSSDAACLVARAVDLR